MFGLIWVHIYLWMKRNDSILECYITSAFSSVNYVGFYLELWQN